MDVKVKSLEWQMPAGPWTYIAESLGLVYRVSQGFGDDTLWEVRLWNDLLTTLPGEAQAKAAAQADYEARILSALEPSP
jgi:hypothetical protein